MSRITKLYKPEDLNEILSLIEGLGIKTIDPMAHAIYLVQTLHDNGWKIVKMMDSREELKADIERKYGPLE